MSENNLKILPPLYMVGMKIYCWKCQKRMPVIALVAPKVNGTEDEICVLSNTVELPNDILEHIKGRVPTFQYRYSKTEMRKYYANTCPNCGVISGDFFLHSEPGAPFFPTDKNEASLLYMVEIPVNNEVEVQSSFHVGTGELILNYAKKIK